VRMLLATVRYWLPIVAACGCLFASQLVPAQIGWVLIIAGFGLLLDGVTAMFERAGGTGGLFDHRQ
jgi:hypothetical protein